MKTTDSIMTQQLRRFFTYILPLALFSSIFIVSCGTDSDSSMGSLEVRLHDAPMEGAEEVNVAIKQVEINETGSEGGWSVISSPNQTYNLLELTNGAYEVLGDTTLPAGTYEQIRLVLDETGHNIVVDGQTYTMDVPSGNNTGIKLNVDAEIEENIQYNLLLDFSVARSVVQTGNSQSGVGYKLKPVVHATNQAVTGAITGTADPADSKPFVYAIAGQDTLASTVADITSGEFTLIGLEEGTYDVSLDPRNDNFQIKDTTGISVNIGETNELETLTLTQN